MRADTPRFLLLDQDMFCVGDAHTCASPGWRATPVHSPQAMAVPPGGSSASCCALVGAMPRLPSLYLPLHAVVPGSTRGTSATGMTNSHYANGNISSSAILTHAFHKRAHLLHLHMRTMNQRAFVMVRRMFIVTGISTFPFSRPRHLSPTSYNHLVRYNAICCAIRRSEQQALTNTRINISIIIRRYSARADSGLARHGTNIFQHMKTLFLNQADKQLNTARPRTRRAYMVAYDHCVLGWDHQPPASVRTPSMELEDCNYMSTLLQRSGKRDSRTNGFTTASFRSAPGHTHGFWFYGSKYPSAASS